MTQWSRHDVVSQPSGNTDHWSKMKIRVSTSDVTWRSCMTSSTLNLKVPQPFELSKYKQYVNPLCAVSFNRIRLLMILWNLIVFVGLLVAIWRGSRFFRLWQTWTIRSRVEFRSRSRSLVRPYWQFEIIFTISVLPCTDAVSYLRAATSEDPWTSFQADMSITSLEAAFSILMTMLLYILLAMTMRIWGLQS